MTTLRRTLLGLLVGVLCLGTPQPAQAQQLHPVPIDFSGSLTLVSFVAQKAYFGAASYQPAAATNSDYRWYESVARLGMDLEPAEGVTGRIGLVGSATVGMDYYGGQDLNQLIVDNAWIGIARLGVENLSVILGRQDVVIGDGFVIGDGYYDSGAALWSIPLNFWDALRLKYADEQWDATAMLANLSTSYGQQEGVLGGGDVSYTAPGGITGAFGYWKRSDSGPSDNDAAVATVRAGLPFGMLQVNGELALESGTVGGLDQKGEAYHADLIYQLDPDRGTYLKGSYLHYSGDDPGTVENEGYQSWHYLWYDWSQYYLGELIGSTLLFNSDQNVIKGEFGFKPSDSTLLRVFLLNFSLDTGESFGGLPAGGDKGFANEINVVLDYTPDPNFSAWALLGYAQPLDSAKQLVGTEDAIEFLISFSIGF